MQTRHPNAAPAIAELQALFGDRVSTGASIRDHHGHGESWHPTATPDAVFFALSAEEVQQAVKICAGYKVPMVAFAAGSALEGQLQALEGGISIDVSRMTKVFAVRPDDMDCTVEPGVTREMLNAHCRDLGLFFPVDPGAEASLGGMAATRASGTNAVRYGTIRETVLSLKVVLPDGRLIKTGQRARKSAAGYDLTHLFIGSEGTLGIIVEMTLKLFPIPEKLGVATCHFPDMQSAVDTVVETMQAGVQMSRIELADAVQIKAINLYSKMSLAEAPTLFFEFSGSETSVDEQVEIVQALAEDHGASGFSWATTEEERRALWHARHSAAYADLQLRPGCKGLSTDACVPISRLAECVTATYKDLEGSPLPAPLVGHVGDGNFHLFVVFDPDSPEELAEAKRLSHTVARRAISMEGTCTGEHGIGTGKRELLVEELGEDAISVMRAIKAAIDPHNLMNPGKIFL